jgi:hypothetical protein
LVKCPKCGMEYSLGTRIYHFCEEHSICHGVIFGDDRICRSWNCNPIEDFNRPNIKLTLDTTYHDKNIVLAIK